MGRGIVIMGGRARRFFTTVYVPTGSGIFLPGRKEGGDDDGVDGWEWMEVEYLNFAKRLKEGGEQWRSAQRCNQGDNQIKGCKKKKREREREVSERKSTLSG